MFLSGVLPLRWSTGARVRRNRALVAEASPKSFKPPENNTLPKCLQSVRYGSRLYSGRWRAATMARHRVFGIVLLLTGHDRFGVRTAYHAIAMVFLDRIVYAVVSWSCHLPSARFVPLVDHVSITWPSRCLVFAVFDRCRWSVTNTFYGLGACEAVQLCPLIPTVQ